MLKLDMLELMWQDVLPAIFADCVGPPGLRSAIHEPFVCGEHVYAADGRICVRMPLQRVAAAIELRWTLAPEVSELFRYERDYEDAPTPWPDPGRLPPPRSEPCEECRGRGLAERPRRVCAFCRGRRVIHVIQPIAIRPGWRQLNDHYVRLLMGHGASLFLPIKLDSLTPYRFELEGGIDGRLMTLASVAGPMPAPCGHD